MTCRSDNIRTSGYASEGPERSSSSSTSSLSTPSSPSTEIRSERRKLTSCAVKGAPPSTTSGFDASSSSPGCVSTSFSPMVASSIRSTSNPWLRMFCTTPAICSDSETDSWIASPNCSISLRTRAFIPASSSHIKVPAISGDPDSPHGYPPTLRLMTHGGKPHHVEWESFTSQPPNRPTYITVPASKSEPLHPIRQRYTQSVCESGLWTIPPSPDRSGLSRNG